jgi:hypothetical protein
MTVTEPEPTHSENCTCNPCECGQKCECGG